MIFQRSSLTFSKNQSTLLRNPITVFFRGFEDKNIFLIKPTMSLNAANGKAFGELTRVLRTTI
ncbi:hypothetical protein DLM75_08535 [Leptospira stimsonii]|uniref:Uncharacterized protein n=1 Tax=Leptospira stimsonii TaxID=2202203 RepID=A0A396ZA28_9LEPT|nr:hypothetical protein DLM75_08535 [Leptospira stimsonii]